MIDSLQSLDTELDLIDVSRKDNADAQREKEKISLLTGGTLWIFLSL